MPAMPKPRGRSILAALLAACLLPGLALEAATTREALAARRDKMARARDALRSLAAKPKPASLPASEARLFADTVASIREMATGLDGVAARLTQGLGQPDPDLDSLSELADQQELRLQAAMDRMSRAATQASNVLKKTSEAAEQIVRNAK